MVQLKVLNLNIWGIPFISKNVPERLKALIAVLSDPSADWDFVVLEEVWSDSDYRLLQNSIRSHYPYSYYFYSGVIGSGVCVFSKGRIISVLSHRYSLNGYAHKVQHGDWFGGKVAGLCKIVHKGLRINLYATHIHAEYNRKNDEYLSHRISQAYELSQFIRCTNFVDDDVNIVAGDFNFEPVDLGYDVVCRLSGLKDSWTNRKNLGETDGETCNTPDNIYSIIEQKEETSPRGKRIDYVLYGECGGRTKVTCSSCRTVLNKIPNSELCYSDHKAVEAVLDVSSHLDTPVDEILSQTWDVKTNLKIYDNCLDVLNASLTNAASTKRFHILLLSAVFMALLCTIDTDYQSGSLGRWSMMGFRLFMVILMIWSFVTAFILSPIEKHSLLATRNAVVIQRDWELGENSKDYSEKDNEEE